MNTFMQTKMSFKIHPVHLVLIFITCFMCGTASYAAGTERNKGKVVVGNFSNNDLSGWKERSFEGNTQYTLVEKEGQTSLHADAQQSASALYKKIKVNIQEYPYLNWSWKANSKYASLDEQNKPGDDYVARVYVVVKRGVLPWKTYALNYVWSSNENPDESWPNAFTKNAIMIPVRSSRDADQVWWMEKVNVYEDLKQYLNFDVKEVNGVAVMTDADNTELNASANYGEIYFSSD